MSVRELVAYHSPTVRNLVEIQRHVPKHEVTELMGMVLKGEDVIAVGVALASAGTLIISHSFIKSIRRNRKAKKDQNNTEA